MANWVTKKRGEKIKIVRITDIPKETIPKSIMISGFLLEKIDLIENAPIPPAITKQSTNPVEYQE